MFPLENLGRRGMVRDQYGVVIAINNARDSILFMFDVAHDRLHDGNFDIVGDQFIKKMKPFPSDEERADRCWWVEYDDFVIGPLPNQVKAEV